MILGVLHYYVILIDELNFIKAAEKGLTIFHAHYKRMNKEQQILVKGLFDEFAAKGLEITSAARDGYKKP